MSPYPRAILFDLDDTILSAYARADLTWDEDGQCAHRQDMGAAEVIEAREGPRPPIDPKGHL